MDVVQSLRAIVGNDGVLDAKETATRAAGVMRFDTLVAQALVRPKTTEQVSAVVRWCNDNGLRVVTHGGLTGLVHGADAGPRDVIPRAAGVMRFDTLVAQALVRPKTTEQVSAVVRWCNDNGLRVVTHGGLTGLVHGADAGPRDVILSLERMRAIESIDPQQRTATVQAGVVRRRCRKPSTRSNWRSRSISARAGPRRSAAMPQPMPAATASFATV